MSDNNLVTKQDLSTFYNNILPYLGGGTKLAGPVGMIISYMGTTAPNGYLACDGSWFDIGDYPKLANWMMEEFESYSYFALSGETVPTGKFKVPDLRGEFLRGTGTNSHANQGSGANVGVHQDGTEHPFITGNALGIYVRHLVNDTSLFLNVDSNVNPSTKYFSANGSDKDDTGTRYAHITSRPTNTSVLYCIKYEEYEGDGAGEVYSTDERVVGKWIDGTPVYQKTIVASPISAGESWDTLGQINNVSTIVSLTGFLKGNNNSGYAIPMAGANGSWYAYLYYTEGEIKCDSKGFASYTPIVIVQYTKTT